MNGYHSELNPQKLDQEALQTLLRDDELYYLYTDALVLIHDLICEFSPEDERPRFTPDEIGEQIAIIQNKLHTERDDLIVLENPVSSNITQNYQLAWNVRKLAEEQYKTAAGYFEVGQAAAQFSRGILQIYTTVRTLKRASEPTRS